MGNNTRLSPRQKMINLMYIVLTAMLALNVSSDVLNGFTQVEEGLKRTNNAMPPYSTPFRHSPPKTPTKDNDGMTKPPKCAESPTGSTSISTP